MSPWDHPRTNEKAKRMSTVLKDMLWHWVSPRQDNWGELLDCAEFAVNSAHGLSVKSTLRLNHRRDPLTPLKLGGANGSGSVHEMQGSLKMAELALDAAQYSQRQ